VAPLPIEIAGDAVLPGEVYLAETPALRGHAGTQPDLFLRWNAIPLAAESIDVVVYLHGFSQQGGAMPLTEKVPRSGLDLSGRARPTLALLPRGNWIRHYYYDFPALLGGGIDALITHALEQLRQATGLRRLGLDRLVLSAHSGGVMPAIDILAAARRSPDELYLFDGLYGRDPRLGDPMQGLEVIDSWLRERLAHEPGNRGALRIVYIERQTGPFSRELADLLAQHFAPVDPALAVDLARRYRVEHSGVPHGYISWRCLPELLADPAIEFDWSRV
jgi:hypothetical protein